MSGTQTSGLRRAAHRRRARWGRFRRWGLGAAALGLPFAVLPADQAKSQALPTGGNVVGGSGTISQTSANQLTINQNSATLSIDWQSFSVGAGNIVRFIQPDSSSLALNRVIGPDPSMIFGSIQANGRVVIMNPAGIYFGPSAMVDVNGLVATTSRMNQADFLAGNLNFSIAGDINARVINEGFVNVAQGGFAVLSAAAVENKGTIVAQGGTVVLAGTPTFTLDFFGDGLLKFASTGTVNQAPTGASALVDNSGTVQANGGRVLMTARAARDVINNVINVTGIVEARSARIENGEIVIDGGENGIVSVNASLDVSGQTADAKGGTIKVLGEKVGLFENARLDASGDAGGGTVLVGGNYQGKGPEANSRMVYMDARAVIDASSALADGGRVILWSDEATRNAGHIDVSGAVNGGFIEVSSKGFLDFRGTVGLQGGTGSAGSLLLDPTDITISGSASSGDMSGSSPFSGTNASSNLYVATLNAALNGGTVIVSTNSAAGGTGYIDITTGITNSAANSTLVLQADGAITITGAGSINSGGYLLNVVFQAASNISIGGAISTSGGNITTTGYAGTGKAAGNLTTTANINTGGGLLNVNQTGSVDFGANVTVGGGTGIVTLNADGAVTQSAGSFNAGGDLVIGGTGAVTLAQAGNNFLNITLNRSGTSNSVTLYNNITGNIQTSTLGTGGFAYTSATAGFTQSGAITQDAGAIGTVSINGGSGNVTLSQANSWSGDLSVGGANITVSGVQTFTNTVSKSANFVQTGAGGVSISGNILATSGSVAVLATSDTQVAIGAHITTLGGNIQLYGNAPGGNPASGNSTANTKGVWIDTGTIIDAGGGNIDIQGRGGNVQYNYGVYVTGGAQILTSGAGTLAIGGQGGLGSGDTNAGVVINSSALIRVQNGQLTIGGDGGTGSTGYHTGVSITNSTVTSTGSGGVTVSGNSGAGLSDSVIIDNSSITSSGTGTLRIYGGYVQGTGASLVLSGSSINIGGGSFAGDVTILANTISNTATSLSISRGSAGGTLSLNTYNPGGQISFNGTGGGLSLTAAFLGSISNFANMQIGDSQTGAIAVGAAYTAAAGMSIGMTSGDAITVPYALTVSGAGTLTLDAQMGVAISANLTSSSGAITLMGNVASWTGPYSTNTPTFASTSGTFYGVSILNGADITSTSGNIAIAGKGGDTGQYQHGVYVDTNSLGSTQIATGGAGTVTIFGQGGASPTQVYGLGGHFGIGLYGSSGNTITIGSSNGQVKLVGAGGGALAGNNSDNNVGIQIGYSTIQATGLGDVILTGTGGQGSSRGISTSGTGGVSVVDGNLTVTGTGGSGNNASSEGWWIGYGVDLVTSLTSTGTGAITVNGTGGSGAGADGNTGVYLRGGSSISATGTGNISITGTSGAAGGANHYGVWIDDASITSASSGNIVLASQTTNGGTGIGMQGTSVTVGGATMTGNLTLRSNSISNSVSTLSLLGTSGGTISFTGETDSTTIGVNGASGTAVVSPLLLGWVSGFGTLQIGSSTQTGDIQVDSTTFTNNLSLRTQGAVFTNALTMGAFNLFVIADGGYTQGTGAITTSGTATFFGPGNVTATNAGNAFGTLILSKSGSSANVNIATPGVGLNLGTVNMGTGALTLSADSMTLTGALSTSGGAVSLTADRFINIGQNIDTQGGNITMSANAAGTGGGNDFAGVFINAAAVQSRGGNINITGKGSAYGTSVTGQHGIFLYNGGVISSYTGGGDPTTGTITLAGTGGNFAGTGNSGVVVEGGASQISARDGAITITANGGTGGTGNNGLHVIGGTISTSGSGTIDITGQGGNSASGNQNGVVVAASGQITATAGAISITGDGGTNTGGANRGVMITGAGSAVTGGAGGVTVVGAGGTGAGGYENHGVFLEFGGTIASTAGGTLQITGTGGATGTNSSGLYLNDGGVVSSTSGNVTITASAIDYDAVSLPNGTLSVGGAGTLTINASAPSATSVAMGSSGVISTGTGTTTLNVDSDISFSSAPLTLGGALTIVSTATTGGINLSNAANSIAGTTTITGPYVNLNFRNVAASQNLIVNSSGNAALYDISVTGNLNVSAIGEITLNSPVTIGTGGSVTLTSTGSGAGIDIEGTLTLGNGNVTLASDNWISIAQNISTGGGNILMDATGLYSGAYVGVSIVSGAVVNAGGGNITIDGTGGNTGAGQHGVTMDGSTLTTSGAGTISVTGQGGPSTGGSSRGVYLQSGADIYTVNGALTVQGTGSTTGGFSNDGIWLAGSTIRSTGSGNVTVTGNAGNYGAGFYLTGTGAAVRTLNGNINVTGQGMHDSSGVVLLDFSGAGVIESTGTGNVSVTGTGGTDPGSTVYGIRLLDAVSINSNSGTLTLTGTGGSGNGGGADGINVGNGATVSSSSGLLTLDGTGGQYVGNGVTVAGGGAVSSVAGNIELIGQTTGGSGIVLNDGISALGNKVTLKALTGGVLQSAGSNITAQTLILRGNGAFDLTRGGSGYNNVARVSADVTGNLHLAMMGSGGYADAAIASDTSGTVTGISATGNFTWEAQDSISQSTGAILNIGGTTQLDAQNGGITLYESGNNLGTSIDAMNGAGTVSLRSTSITVGALGVSSAGDLILTATAGGITQSSAITANGNFVASASGGGITMNGFTNTVAGTTALTASGGKQNISWAQSGPMVASNISATGALTIDVTGGSISQVGAMSAVDPSSISATGGNIALTNASNAFGGALSLTATAGSIAVTNSGALTLGAVTASNGLTVTAGGTLQQSGSIVLTGGSSTLSATGTMTLTDSGNNFGSALSLTGVGGALEGTAPAVASVTAVGSGFTFNNTPIANSATTSPGGNEGTTTSTVTTETLAQLITQILTSTVTQPSSSTASTDAANVNPVSPAAVQAMLIAILAEAAGPAGGNGGGEQQGGGETANVNTSGTGTTAGATGTPAASANAGTFGAGTTITINTSGGAVQSITVTPVGGGAPVTILPGLLNLTPPAIPTATATGTPGISGNFPLSWRQ